MNNIDTLIIDSIKARLRKIECIKLLKYEKAAQFRDNEKTIGIKIYKILSSEIDKLYSYEKCESLIDFYCIETYGFSYKLVESSAQLVRAIKLKNLGI